MRKFFHFIIQHLAAFKISVCHLARAPMNTLLTVMAIGVSLSLPISLYFLTSHIQALSQGWNQGTSITLYVDAKSPEPEINAILTQAKNTAGVIATQYLTPKEALRDFENHSNLGDTLALLPENPLPGVITIQLDPKIHSHQSLTALKDSFAKMPQVEIATLDDEWIEKFKTLLDFGKTLAHFLYFIIGMSVILMVGNTIRLALENAREEIEVLNLIGATHRFIRRPFLYRGMLYGILGGMIAIGILSSELYFFQAPMQKLALIFESIFTLRHLTFDDVIIFLAFTIALGWSGATLAFYQQKRAILKES